jgi:ribonucleotide reductase alpha subunit
MKSVYQINFTHKANVKSLKCTGDHIFLTTEEKECKAIDLKGKRIAPHIEEMQICNDNTSLLIRALKAGYIQGDGSTGRLDSKTHKGLEINIGKKDKELLGVNYFNQPNHTARKLYLTDAMDLAKEFKLSGNPLPTRDLPIDIESLDIDTLRHFLCGLYSANGSVVSSTRVAFKTTCGDLAKRLANILANSFGIDTYTTTNKPSLIKWENGEYLSKESYDVNIHKWSSLVEFAKQINFIHSYKREALKKTIIERSPTVASVVYLGEKFVYDFTEPSTHFGVVSANATCGFVAHNCGELYSVPWSCCELCAVNVLEHLTEVGSIDFKGLEASVRTSVRLLDYLLDKSYYPDERYKERTLAIRPIGVGVANLGALLVAMGESYSSERGRLLAEDIYEHITKYAYLESVELAKELGSYPALYDSQNKKRALRIADKLLKDDDFSKKHILKEISNGFLRNSQLTTAQPTGTTGIVLGAETGGIEPYFALFTRKRLVGGGILDLPSKTVSDALSKKLGKEVTPDNLKETLETLSLTDREVFKTAHEISWEDHIKMVSALQKRISSGLSKTINMSNDATVEDIEKAYVLAWQLGLKGVTVYRDGSKNLQPIVNSKQIKIEEKVAKPELTGYRKKLPKTRKSVTHTLEVGGFECYITVGLHEDGNPGEVFIRASKEGSMVNGLLDSFAICISYCLQYGVPLQKLIDKLSDTRFEPNGWTTDSDVPVCSSVVDYLARWMKKQFVDNEDQDIFEILEKSTKVVETVAEKNEYGGPPCPNCGSITQRSGTCFICSNCGTNVGGCTS